MFECHGSKGNQKWLYSTKVIYFLPRMHNTDVSPQNKVFCFRKKFCSIPFQTHVYPLRTDPSYR